MAVLLRAIGAGVNAGYRTSVLNRLYVGDCISLPRHRMRFGVILLIGIVWSQDIILRRVQKAVQKEPELPSVVQPAAERLWLKGKVVDASAGEPLAGAHIKVLGSILGAVADAQGEFFIPTTLTQPVEVEATYVGYHPQRFTITPSPTKENPPTLALSAQEIISEEVVIAASRTEERFLRSPVQIFPLSGLQLRQSPVGIDAHTISFLPGVDISYSSITFPILNTRGFNSPQNPRFINRVDGIEMQSVALGVPVFPFTSAPDIDVANAEVIYGPASALYGPNAFNGALITTLRSPFAYRGLSARVRAGMNNAAHPFRPNPSPYLEVQARYAHVWQERLGVKVALQLMDTEDWLAWDTTDIAGYSGVGPPYNIPGSQNPGYQPAGGYGDDARIYYSGTPIIFADGKPIPPFYVSRTPYFEPELVSPSARIGKLSGGVFYRFSDQLQGELTFLLSTGRTVYLGGYRYALQDFLFQAYKAEITHPRGFLRAYTFREYGGGAWV
ncbi:MAG: carboxypeptidase-like regulatory domain-containing protein, partial [Bacteroidia bacterium]|nr:carboxypeptidase-like regulatory domain-containing protein [Bacteroidia bacterium]